jgi:predicted transcriptional regulator
MKINTIRFGKRGVETLLSPLESDVLRILWKKEHVKAREVYDLLKRKRKVALTSVVVILDRLHKKGLVKRITKPGRGGYHYIYTPNTTKIDFEHSVMEGVTDKLIATFGNSAVNYFNERFSKRKGRK